MIYEDVKSLAQDLWSIGKTLQNVELQAKILQLQKAVNLLVGEGLEKDRKIAELEEVLSFKEKLERKDQMLWSGEEGPFCTRCWEVDDKRVSLHQVKDDPGTSLWYKCPQCKTHYNPGKIPTVQPPRPILAHRWDIFPHRR